MFQICESAQIYISKDPISERDLWTMDTDDVSPWRAVNPHGFYLA